MRSAGRLGPRPSAGVSSLIAPVPPIRLDAVGRKDLAGVEGDDWDLLLVDDRQDPPTGIDHPVLRWWRRPAGAG